MDLSEAMRIVSRVKYKPGWSAELLSDFGNLRSYGFNDAYVRVVATMPNSRAPIPAEVMITTTQPIPGGFLEGCGVDELLLYAKMVIDGLEDHESYEWFRYENRLVKDPHE